MHKEGDSQVESIAKEILESFAGLPGMTVSADEVIPGV